MAKMDSSNLGQKSDEVSAVAWAADMAAAGVIKLESTKGDPAWEYKLQNPGAGSNNTAYVKTLQGIIGNDPVLTKQALEMFRNPEIKDKAENAAKNVGIAYCDKIRAQSEERAKNPPREI